jgi:propanol-preferring alcohol dehydrogenase
MVLRVPGPIQSSPLEIENVAEPKPGTNQILVRVSACGICHTDLHTVEGELELPVRPIIPGHQIVGTVEAVGPVNALPASSSGFRIGDRVGIPWLNSTDGTCRFCRSGRENLCEHARFTGLHVNGGYAEYTVVDRQFAYPLTAGRSDVETAPLLCAGIIGLRALRLSRTQPGGRLGLFGFGASAHIALQIAKYWGCRVFVFTRGMEHRRLAITLGADWAGGGTDTPPERLDSAVVLAPVGELARVALKHLDRGGTVAMAGIHSTPIPEIEYRSIYHERAITSVANSTREDARELLQLSAKAPIKTEVEVFRLEDANRALQLLKAGKIRGAAVLELSV